MSKYSGMSDFEINVEVINALYPDNRYQFNKYPSGSTVCAWTGDGSGGQDYFDFCYYYTQAMQLLIDNGISLFNRNIDYMATKQTLDTKVIQACSKNPCRAIAECFLLMKDRENKHGANKT